MGEGLSYAAQTVAAAAKQVLLVQGGVDIGLQFGKTFHQQRMKRAAFPCQDHADALFMGNGRLIDPLAGKGVVHVGQGYHLRGHWDLLPLEPVRVTPPVVALVVPAAYLVGNADQGKVLINGQILQHPGPDGGMGLHQFKFLSRQLPRLVEDVLRNGDLPHVMQGGGGGDGGNLGGGKARSCRLIVQVVEDQFGKAADMTNVESTFPVAKLHDMAQYFDHQVALLFLFVHLLGHHVHQLLLLGIKENGVHHPLVNDQCVKGAADKIGGAEGIGSFDLIRPTL